MTNMTTMEPTPGRPVRDQIGRRGYLLVAVMASLAGGCGDDGGSGSNSVASSLQRRPPPTRQAAADATEANELKFYTKVEDIVGPEQAARIRHRFLPEDFEPDVGGNRNRDPFRSYVIQLIGNTNEEDERDESVAESCKDMVAKDQPLRDLRLVGIVLRGTRSYALFVDSRSHGHVITKNDCLGLEQALVSSVRAGFVSLEIVPDATQNQPTPEPQKRVIPLYPNELLVEDGER